MSIARSRLVHLTFPDMRLRFAWVTLLFVTLLIAAAPAIDEVPVFQAIRDSVTELQTALHRKVASILIAKVADKVAGTSYESTWQVTVRYYLDYSTPEDVPYLRGMRKCLAESGPTAGKEWVTWAESQIRLIREGYAEEIAFQQELRMAVTVTASLDPSGGLVASSVEASHAVSDSVMVTFRAEILAAPSDSQIQEAGYNFLRDRLSPKTQPSGGSTQEPKGTSDCPSTLSAPSGSSTSSTPSASSGSPGTGVILPRLSRNPEEDRMRTILRIGIAGLVVLLLLLIINQRLLHRRAQSTPPRGKRPST